MECLSTTVTFLLKLPWRRDFDISLKHRPKPSNCAASMFKTKAFLSCYTDVIFLIFVLTTLHSHYTLFVVNLLILQNRRIKMKSRSGEGIFHQWFDRMCCVVLSRCRLIWTIFHVNERRYEFKITFEWCLWHGLLSIKHVCIVGIIIFMETTPLCLLLNKSHVFSLIQNRFILIQLFTLTCQENKLI